MTGRSKSFASAVKPISSVASTTSAVESVSCGEALSWMNGSFGVRMEYRVEPRALGTAGAVKNCEDFYAGEDLLLISGDAACDFDLAALWRQHRRSGAAATIALKRDSSPLRFGLAVCDGDGLVRGFVEKPDWENVRSFLVNTGVYFCAGEVLDLDAYTGGFNLQIAWSTGYVAGNSVLKDEFV